MIHSSTTSTCAGNSGATILVPTTCVLGPRKAPAALGLFQDEGGLGLSLGL